MVNKQPEALRLANELEDSLYSSDGTSLSLYCQGIADEAADELRRLHESNQELLEALKEVYDWCYPTDSPWAVKARAAIAKAERTTT